MVRYSPTPAASTRWRSTGSIIVDTGAMRRALNVVVMVASWDIVPVGSLARSFGTVVTLSSPLSPGRVAGCHLLQGGSFVSTIRERGSLGRTVATQKLDFCFEESPGSMDKLPGNAWAPFTR